MWLTTFTTRHGNICIRFGSRALNIQACAVAKPVVSVLKRYPTAVGLTAALLPILLQIYLASKEPKK